MREENRKQWSHTRAMSRLAASNTSLPQHSTHARMPQHMHITSPLLPPSGAPTSLPHAPQHDVSSSVKFAAM